MLIYNRENDHTRERILSQMPMSVKEVEELLEQFRTFDPFEYYNEDGSVDIQRLISDGNGRMIKEIGFEPDGSISHIKLRNDNSGTVYIIGGESTGLYKIGYATDYDVRYRALLFSSPVGLNHVGRGVVRDAKKTEAILHDMFQDKREHGEWFRLSEADIEAALNIIRG